MEVPKFIEEEKNKILFKNSTPIENVKGFQNLELVSKTYNLF